MSTIENQSRHWPFLSSQVASEVVVVPVFVWTKYHRSLLLNAQLIMCRHWFKQWLGTKLMKPLPGDVNNRNYVAYGITKPPELRYFWVRGSTVWLSLGQRHGPFVRTMHLWAVDSPRKGPVTRKVFPCHNGNSPLIARFMGPTWGPSGAARTQAGPMLAP